MIVLRLVASSRRPLGWWEPEARFKTRRSGTVIALAVTMPDLSNSALQKASDLLSRAEYQEAAAVLAPVFEADPNNTPALRMLGEAMHQLGQHEQALALLADSISSGGVDVGTLCRISDILKELQRDEESADFIMLAAENCPTDKNLMGRAVGVLTQLGRTEDAMALLAPKA